jgi:hypothetical protein
MVAGVIGYGAVLLGLGLLAVVYDPGHPQVASLASDVGDTSSAWVETIVGGFFLVLVPLSILFSLMRRRRRRAGPAAAALGD